MRQISTLVGAAILAAGASAALAQEAKQPPSGHEMMTSRMVTASATVQKIDKQNRKLTLRDDRGKETEVTIGSEVRNFDQIKVGDRVNVRYYESVAVSLRKPGEPLPPTTTREQTERAPIGQRPEGMMSKQTTMAAQIVSVDPNLHTVVLRGADGKQRTATIQDPQLQRKLSELKPGDQIDVTMTEAMAVSVEPAAPARPPIPK